MTMFDKLKNLVLAGEEPRPQARETIVFEFLESYYYCEAAANEKDLPVEDRPSGVLDVLHCLLSHGATLNPKEEERQPLMAPVGALDVAMTEYLLEKGADPHYDLPYNIIAYGCGNYYIDELDILVMEESFVNAPDTSVFDRALQIAVLLAKHGVANVRTHCIVIDGEEKTVQVISGSTAF